MAKVAEIILFPPAPFILEMRSERMVDLLIALGEAGFETVNIRDSNRFKIIDAEGHGDGQKTG